MQTLKALVIFLGVLIVIGMGIFAYGVAMKFGTVADGNDTAGVVAPVPVKPWERVRISLPAGARVAETVVADGRMVVRLVLADDGQRYLIFNLEDGAKLGEIDFEPEAGAQ